MYLTYYWAEEEGGEIVIKEKNYDELKNPSFAPEVDLYALSIPVNQFSVDIVTTDSFLSLGFCFSPTQTGSYLFLPYWFIVHLSSVQSLSRV